MFEDEKFLDYICNVLASALLSTGNKQNDETLRTEHQRVVQILLNDEN